MAWSGTDEPPPDVVHVRDSSGDEATRGAFCPTCGPPNSLWHWVLVDRRPRSPDVSTAVCWLDLDGSPPFDEVQPGQS